MRKHVLMILVKMRLSLIKIHDLIEKLHKYKKTTNKEEKLQEMVKPNISSILIQKK